MQKVNEVFELKPIFHDLLNSKKNLAVCVHARPDGDAVGAQVGCTRCLNALGGRAFCLLTDPIPSNLKCFFKDTPCIGLDDLKINDWLPVALDCSDEGRINPHVLNAFGKHFYLSVDHHPLNTLFARHNLVDTNASATCELLARHIYKEALPIDLTGAEALYAGIISDTGNFTHSCTTSQTLFYANFLIQKGVEPYKVANALYAENPLNRLQLLALFLKRIELELNGRLAIVTLFPEDYLKTKTHRVDTEGFIAHALSVQGVQVAAFLESNKGYIKGSVRSKFPTIAVNQIAQSFGGGGHVCAAGFRVENESLDSVRSKLVQRVESILL